MTSLQYYNTHKHITDNYPFDKFLLFQKDKSKQIITGQDYKETEKVYNVQIYELMMHSLSFI